MMIEHNQEMEIFQLGSNLFKMYNNKNKTLNVSAYIQNTHNTDEIVFILHSAHYAG